MLWRWHAGRPGCQHGGTGATCGTALRWSQSREETGREEVPDVGLEPVSVVDHAGEGSDEVRMVDGWEDGTRGVARRGGTVEEADGLREVADGEEQRAAVVHGGAAAWRFPEEGGRGEMMRGWEEEDSGAGLRVEVWVAGDKEEDGWKWRKEGVLRGRRRWVRKPKAWIRGVADMHGGAATGSGREGGGGDGSRCGQWRGTKGDGRAWRGYDLGLSRGGWLPEVQERVVEMGLTMEMTVAKDGGWTSVVVRLEWPYMLADERSLALKILEIEDVEKNGSQGVLVLGGGGVLHCSW